MRPLIGIPCHADFRAGTGRPVYCNNRAYVHAVESAGGVPVLIPMLSNLRDLDTLLPRLDGLLLPGGVDVQPGRYGEDPHPLTDEFDLQLDEFEMALASWALQEDIPTLGVCRGMQMLNIACGGSLYQDIANLYPGAMQHCRRELPRTELTHAVAIEAGSRMEKIMGVQKISVNSLHHQALNTPGKGVRVSGRAEDGIAELIEIDGYHFMVAAQCHPEEIYTKEPAFDRLFKAFTRACSHLPEDEPEVETVMLMPDVVQTAIH